MTMSNYLLKVKNLVDILKYSGHVSASYDHVMYILSDLHSEYDLGMESWSGSGPTDLTGPYPK